MVIAGRRKNMLPTGKRIFSVSLSESVAAYLDARAKEHACSRSLILERMVRDEVTRTRAEAATERELEGAAR